MIEKLLPENTTLFKEQTTKSSRGIKVLAADWCYLSAVGTNNALTGTSNSESVFSHGNEYYYT